MLSSLCQLFHPLPLPDSEEELVLQLKNLYLGEHGGSSDGSSETPKEGDPIAKELEMKTRVCGTVLTSYDMSLRDTMQLVSSKLEACGTLIEQLGGGRNSCRKENTLTEAQQHNSTE